MKKARIVRQKQLAHIQNEVKILARLRCDFIVNLRGVFQDDNNLALVLDFVPGGELFSHLRRAGKFDEATAKFYVAELAVCIDALHKLFICHRYIDSSLYFACTFTCLREIDNIVS